MDKKYPLSILVKQPLCRMCRHGRHRHYWSYYSSANSADQLAHGNGSAVVGNDGRELTVLVKHEAFLLCVFPCLFCFEVFPFLFLLKHCHKKPQVAAVGIKIVMIPGLYFQSANAMR